MYKIFMAIAVPALIVAWIAYFLWQRHLDKIEKQRPRPVSEKLQQRHSEVAEWAAKMAAFKPPKPPVSQQDDQTDQSNP
ncbi:MAG: hypothetical protein QHH07_05735 [Sedimentisphaerales bacterium]|jgi:C4-dicarboxylate transporter|nr:hypothetical protein [Sedimentisphaerales bacterium]